MGEKSMFPYHVVRSQQGLLHDGVEGEGVDAVPHAEAEESAECPENLMMVENYSILIYMVLIVYAYDLIELFGSLPAVLYVKRNEYGPYRCLYYRCPYADVVVERAVLIQDYPFYCPFHHCYRLQNLKPLCYS